MQESLEAVIGNSPPAAINRIPRATYRIQLRPDFTFDDVRHLLDYLERLGISDIYLSPLFRARKDSAHGYDVVNHSTMEPEFGDPATFSRLAEEVRNRGMGILLDVVPNHMGIHDSGNVWWNDVLENGEVAKYAGYFDIDWNRLGENLRHKILLPVLGDHFGQVLERGELQLAYDQGRFRITYYESQFPLTPLSWPLILECTLGRLGEGNGERCDVVELQSIHTQLANLPPKHEQTAVASRERYREQQVASRRLAALVDKTPAVRTALEDAIKEINGAAGDASSFDILEQLLDQQWYRLAHWRVAGDEINYRRFFDINDLAAIRVEKHEVFESVHALIEQLLEQNQITGLRIDHPDGLLDPRRYFDELQKLYHRTDPANAPGEPAPLLYVVVEKILSGEEPLTHDWPVCGTTGYELLNDINRALVDGDGLQQLRNEYASISGIEQPASEIVYQSKKAILDDAMSSELNVLAGRIHRVAQRHRHSRDFTFPALHRALRELIACFLVYRTYVPPRGWDVDDADYARVTTAVRWAKLRNPTMTWSVLDFLASVLLLQYPTDVDEPDREEFRDFVLKFQQITGPVTAKGIEDTAFYRYYPLASMNEVGGELDSEPYAADEFHRRMQHRASDWPHGLSATATHDTKRGEDVRMRLHVLAEIADRWLGTVRHWQELNRPLIRSVHNNTVPNRNEEYLIYQTLVGTWPVEPMSERDRQSYQDRIVAYLRKALREAKVNTAWANPAEEYEQAVLDFTSNLLAPERSEQFLHELDGFVRKIADTGFINSLAQVVLKGTLPGVPDFYQGTELWDFSLVDPDNRRPVDYGQRQHWIDDMEREFERSRAGLLNELRSNWPDPRIKLLIIWRLLQARASHAELFAHGTYVPLTVTGAHANHVLAFARKLHDHMAVVAVPLHIHRLLHGEARATGHRQLPNLDWHDTAIELPDSAPQQWTEQFTAASIGDSLAEDGARRVSAAELLGSLPVGLLISNS